MDETTTETLDFDEAVSRASRDDLVAAMEWALSETLYIDSSGVITDDCSCGDYYPEFEARVRECLVEALSERLSFPERAPATADLVVDVVSEVTTRIYDWALEDAYCYIPERCEDATSDFAEQLASILGVSEVSEPSWPELLCTLIEEELYVFDLDGVEQICLDTPLRAEVLLGPDGVWAGDPMSTEAVLDFVRGVAEEPDLEQRAQPPALALASAAGVGVDQLRDAAKSIQDGTEPKATDARSRLALSLVTELNDYIGYGCSQVAVLCSATLPELARLMSGKDGQGLAVGPEPPTCGLFDRLGGSGGSFSIELPEGLVIGPRGSSSELTVDRILLPEASGLSWYTVNETYGLLPSVYDARLGSEVTQDQPRVNPPLEQDLLPSRCEPAEEADEPER